MKAIILLSGGVDSTIALAMALNRGLTCFGLSFNYGQRHKIELKYASLIAQKYGIEHKIIHIDPKAFSKSSLIDGSDAERPIDYYNCLWRHPKHLCACSKYDIFKLLVDASRNHRGGGNPRRL